MRPWQLVTGILMVAGCGSKPVLPGGKNVKVSREPASPRCREIGPVRGSTVNIHGKAEDALQDMQREASEKGANYVVVREYSGLETAVTGVAYDCP